MDESVKNEIGLAIGCDSGIVDFRDINNHLISIGDSVVWANRMNSEGGVGETIVHEPLAFELDGLLGIEMTQRNGETKHGVPFNARNLKFLHT